MKMKMICVTSYFIYHKYHWIRDNTEWENNMTQTTLDVMCELSMAISRKIYKSKEQSNLDRARASGIYKVNKGKK